HFQVVGENEDGDKVEGGDFTFTTPVAAPANGNCSNEQFRVGPSAALPECRAFELASLPDLGGYSVRGGSGQVATDGEGVLWTTDGVVPDAEEPLGVFDAFRSRRGPNGWTSEIVSPPGNKIKGSFNNAVSFASPDLSRMIWSVEREQIDPTD